MDRTPSPSHEEDFALAESEVPNFSFATQEGILNVLPFAEALSVVAQDHFTFLSAKSGPAAVAPAEAPLVEQGVGDPTELRFKRIEDALASITGTLSGLAAQRQASPATAAQTSGGAAPPDRYPGLDPGIVQQAIKQCGDHRPGGAVELAGDPTGRRLLEPRGPSG